MIALKDKDLFRQQALIGGNWRDANAKATVDVIDPASQQVLGTIPDMGRDETRAAIDAAADAFKRWKKTLMQSVQRSWSVGMNSCGTMSRIWRFC